MIEAAIRALLLSSIELTNLIGDRITAGTIPQDQASPCLYFGADRVQPLPVRTPMGTFSGVLEVGFEAEEYYQIEAITKAVRGVMDNFSGISEGVSLRIEAGRTTPDDYDDKLKLRIRALEFDVNGQELTP